MTSASVRSIVILCILLMAVTMPVFAQGSGSEPAALLDPDTAMAMPFTDFAASLNIDASALAAELNFPADADLSTSLGQLLKDAGIGRTELQKAIRKLRDAAPEAVTPEAAPAVPEPESATPREVSPDEAMAMSFTDFAAAKDIEPHRLAKALGLPHDADLTSPLGQLLEQNNLGRADIQKAMALTSPLAAEAASKNWAQIRLKFILWAAFFIAAMLLLATIRITRPLRVGMLVAAAVIFGVWLGVEPNAPGTVKDAFVLYGEEGVIFPPRLIAFIGFLLMSIIGNKVFCGWGCHFGALQDVLWQLPTRKFKPPFWLSNLIRAAFLAALVFAALSIPADIMEPIDPFRIFRPLVQGAALAVGVSGAMLIAGIWVYRPWCNFLCPFGIVSWLGERISIFRPRVNHNTCIDCRACERSCPTHAIGGIRAKRAFPQDCFACGACIKACPVNAIKWGVKPPPDKPSQADPAEN